MWLHEIGVPLRRFVLQALASVRKGPRNAFETVASLSEVTLCQFCRHVQQYPMLLRSSVTQALRGNMSEADQMAMMQQSALGGLPQLARSCSDVMYLGDSFQE